MADFCTQCAKDNFGPDTPSDLKGLISEEESKKGFGAAVICEGCGHILVNHNGDCVSCHLMGGQPGHGPKGIKD